MEIPRIPHLHYLLFVHICVGTECLHVLGFSEVNFDRLIQLLAKRQRFRPFVRVDHHDPLDELHDLREFHRDLLR